MACFHYLSGIESNKIVAWDTSNMIILGVQPGMKGLGTLAIVYDNLAETASMQTSLLDILLVAHCPVNMPEHAMLLGSYLETE